MNRDSIYGWTQPLCGKVYVKESMDAIGIYDQTIGCTLVEIKELSLSFCVPIAVLNFGQESGDENF